MHCIPGARACFYMGRSESPTDVRELEIHALLVHLQLRIDTQHCQQQIYFGMSREHQLRAEQCARLGDAQGARQFLVERRKMLHYQQLELQQMSVLLAVKEQIERAQRNVEMARHLVTANMTLDELLAAMPAAANGALEDTLDELRDKIVQVCEHSALLAEPLEAADGALDDDELDMQVKELMLEAAPRVVVAHQAHQEEKQPQQPQKQASAVNSKIALKSE